MNHDRLTAVIRHHAQVQVNRMGTKRIGDVTSYNPANNTARVMLQPEGILTGWLPIQTMWVGNGFGVSVGLTTGDQVTVFCQEGDAEAGIIEAGVYSDQQPPGSGGAPAGQFWINDGSGTSMKFTNNGTLTITGNVNITGNLNVTGNIDDANDMHSTLATLRGDYNAHTHTGPFSGTTSTPTPQDT